MELQRFVYAATVKRVVDGDTADLVVDLGFHTSQEMRVRLLGINAPETYGVPHDSDEYQAGKRAADYLRERVEGKEVVLRTEKDRTGKYGRYLATLYLGETDVNEELVEKGLVKRATY
ncbi:MAG: nuclease [Armatimonadetes bacterium CG_4_10_14_3_um_filter_66_18]|nr:nuclease [Armatimonadota bacterium]OIO94820.1 MAG: hypothetical protein AUJ96_27985 [Armatimonadetes bacterium CG2_30_66_41]PIU93682.1 MAG: nuclease [Armatimonadetes bacterium CG06_land_8_20_14_3_00_66_21]PIX47648.1 MAG: nuclease [Armatimonadetes bacterium CG_4_8_14_3_um_filter_66_20]PIY49557.1 MAG: nuclease [Armatimonadetes bacterium CG_4_10_14_3_um_filter_66_18]PIZ44822.1 MAG: nuclease [Armatimonadetes bacterium CG_4_10_14_0_8_um_filter_66_14]PJB71707.1 MAG: nuclease [Armatimonadetes bac